MTGPKTDERPARFALACASVVALVAGMVLVVGWWFGVDLVTRLHPSLVSMKANTAVGFLLLAGALGAIAGALRHQVGVVAAGSATLLGLATSVQYAAGWDLGIDQLLASDTNLLGTQAPGRMGLNTAIGFLLLGPASLLALAGRTRGRHVLAQMLVATTLTLATLATLGYLLGATAAVGLGGATQMALHTSLLFLVTGLGLVAALVDDGPLAVLASRRAGGRTARLALPAAVGAIVLAAVATEALAAAGPLADSRLQLAFNVTISLVLLVGGGLALARRLDATERRALNSRDELVQLVESLGDLYLQVDADDVVVGVHGDDLGLLTPNRLGLPLASATVRQVRHDIVAAVALARVTGDSMWTTVPLGHGPDARAVEVRAVPGEVGSVGIVVRDVSALQRTRLDLERANESLATANESLEGQVERRTEQLSRSNEELRAYPHTIAHELRGPLATITGMAELLRDMGGHLDDAERRDLADRISIGATRLQDLIGGLLLYAEATVHERVAVDLGAEVAWAVDLLQPGWSEAAATLRADDLPTVTTSPQAVRTILLNLLANSLRYRERGRPLVVHVHGGADADGGFHLAVLDNGIGIAEGDRDRVLEPGVRLHPSDVAPGAGLGLSAVSRIARAIGGTVQVVDGIDGLGVGFRVDVAAPDDGAASRPGGPGSHRAVDQRTDATISSSGSSSATVDDGA